MYVRFFEGVDAGRPVFMSPREGRAAVLSGKAEIVPTSELPRDDVDDDELQEGGDDGN